jgi:signal peptide peptidase-like protein 2B
VNRVTVATGGDTGEAIPMLIQFPRLNDELGGYSLLGLGDIALPGLFISFMLRFDYKKKLRGWNGYFLIVTIGYAIGLIFTDIALLVLRMGQVNY